MYYIYHDVAVRIYCNCIQLYKDVRCAMWVDFANDIMHFYRHHANMTRLL